MKFIDAIVRGLVGLLAVVSLLIAAESAAAPAAGEAVVIEVFVREGCPHCEQAEVFLAQLGRERPDLRIVVRENAETGTADVMIRDSGPGIPPETLRRIFEPFYSTKERDETGRGGTGLGLALCREIMEAHRGRIRVESTVGVGTAFTLKFPLVGRSAPVAAAG